jgi:hypothetical protein
MNNNFLVNELIAAERHLSDVIKKYGKDSGYAASAQDSVKNLKDRQYSNMQWYKKQVTQITR